MRQSWAVSAALVMGATCVQAQAQNTWSEGAEDAGTSVSNHRLVSKAGSLNALTAVAGATHASPDLVDVIEINVTDPAHFSFLPPTSNGTYDSRLFLFRSNGIPLLAVDNLSAINGNQPGFNNNNNSMSTALATIGQTFTAGRYLIAITGNGGMPRNFGVTGYTNLFVMNPVGLSVASQVAGPWNNWLNPGATSYGAWGFYTNGVLPIVADSCAEAQYVYSAGEFAVDITQSAASTQTSSCGGGTFDRVVWYRLFLPCASTVRISTCGTVDFDSSITVYEGDCTSLELRNCSAGGCGSGGAAVVEFSDTPCSGGEYLVRVECLWSGTGGTGTVRFECASAPTPIVQSDLNGDGAVNAIDLAQFLSGWTTAP